MIFADLFAGIGGFRLGLEAAGMTCKWACEIDDWCRGRYLNRFPDTELFCTDIRNVYTAEYLDSLVRQWYLPMNGNTYTQEEEDVMARIRKVLPHQIDEAVKMYDSGLSIQDVADFYKVTRQAMWDILRRRTTMRPQKRFGEENNFYRGGARANDYAQNVLEKAVIKGIVEKKTHCEECGDTGTFKDGRSKIQAHHDDYNKPLEVRWLCQKCHHKWHKHNKPKRREVPQEVPRVDLVCGGFP